MRTLSDIVKVALFVALTAVAVELWFLIREARQLVHQTEMVASEAREAIVEVRVQTSEQLARLRDPRNAKALDAAIQVGAVFNATGRLMNRQLIPRAMRTLDNLDSSVVSLNQLIRSTDNSINASLLPQATSTLAQAASSIKQTADSVDVDLQQLRVLLEDPELKLILEEVHKSTKNVAEATEQVAEASKQMPHIAASLDKIAATSAKYRKAMIITQILSTLAWGFWR